MKLGKKEAVLSASYPRELLLVKLGTEKDWRQNWRKTTRSLVNISVGNVMHVQKEASKRALQRVLFKDYAQEYFGTASLRQYLERQHAKRENLLSSPADFTFAGQDMFLVD